jgi:hypothetical protein
MKNIFAKFIIIIKQRNKMAKQFVEIKCYKKSYRVFQEDLKKVFIWLRPKNLQFQALVKIKRQIQFFFRKNIHKYQIQKLE